MCVIIHQPRGAETPAPILHSAYQRNPHGWGIMWATKGRVHVKRGLDWDGFWAAYQNLRRRECLIHFRLATHGAVSLENCHPFEIQPDLYMMHNGVIRIDRADPARSDSWEFARLLRDVVDSGSIHRPEVIAEIERIVGRHNKLAFLSADGRISIAHHREGVFHRGLWFSNTYGWHDPEDPDSPDDTAQMRLFCIEPRRPKRRQSAASRAAMGLFESES